MRLTKKKIYGRKALLDDHNREYFVDNEPIGEQDSTEVDVSFCENLDIRMLESALRVSPPSATVAHLSRLSIHKRLGTSDQDRAILLHDYAEALRGIPEFVVFLACKSFWENDPSPWYPKVITLADACHAILHEFECAMTNLQNCGNARLAGPAKAGFHREDFYSSPKENPIRRELCDFLVSKGEPDYFEMASLYSNYQLECLARGRFGYGKKDGVA